MNIVERLNLLKQHEEVTKEIIEVSYKELELSKQLEKNIEDQEILESMRKVSSHNNDLRIKQQELIKKLS